MAYRGSRSSGFVAPPVAEVPYGGSLGAGVSTAIGKAILGYMQYRDAEEAKAKEEEEADIAKQMESEDLLLQLAPILSMFEEGGIESPTGAAAAPQADEAKFREWYQDHAKRLGLNPDPDDPQHFYDYRAAFVTGAKPDASGHWPSEFKREGHPNLVIEGEDTRTGKPYDLPTIPEGTPTTIPLGKTRFAKPLLEEITLPTGEKISIPPVRGQREQREAEAGAAATFEMQKGTEVLSPELLKLLPKEFQARWQEEQRVPSDALDEVLMELMGEPDSPWSKPYEDEGKSYQYNKSTGTVRLTPGVTTEVEKPEKAKWVTVTDVASGKRIRITETEWNTAPEGTFTDIKPTAPKSALTRDDATAKARVLMGNPGDKGKDTFWGIVETSTVDTALPAVLAGPPTRVGGMVASGARALGMAPNLDLYYSNIEGFAPFFARVVGHKGRLSDKDLARTEKLFPILSGHKTDTRDAAIRKMNRIEAMMAGTEQVPPGLFDPQPGLWPPPEGLEEVIGAVPEPTRLSPGMTSLMKEYGGVGG